MILEQKTRLTPNTVVSLEREFALFHENGAPLQRRQAAVVMDRLRTRLASFHRKTEVVEEVAPNAIEVKICLSRVGSILQELPLIYQAIAATVQQSGVFITGVSQPTAQGLTDDVTHFLTVDIFKAAMGPLAATNSIHLHFGASNEDEAMALYHAGNRIAPIMLDSSQCSWIDGLSRGRAHLVTQFFQSMPPELSTPWSITTLSEYQSMLESVRDGVDRLVGSFSPGYLARLGQQYPTFIDAQGKVTRWSPDKVFHPMRLRPDKELPELGLVASVEFRPLDGQPTLERDLAVLQLTLGLLAFELRHNPTSLSPSEAISLAESTRNIASYGFGAVMWNGLADSVSAKLRALEELAALGIDSRALHDFTMDGGREELIWNGAYASGPTAALIQANHQRFMESANSTRL